MSGAQLYLGTTFHGITTHQKELVVSLALLGAVFGTLVAGPLADKYGRKPIIIASCIIYIVGALIVACAQTIPILMLGRLIIGFDIGIDSFLVPVYLSEVAPLQIRG